MTYTDTMVDHAKAILLEHFAVNGPQRPGDLEDDFACGPSPRDTALGTIRGAPVMGDTVRLSFENTLANWRSSIFFPALKALVKEGAIVWGRNTEDDVYYAVPGALPADVTEENDD